MDSSRRLEGLKKATFSGKSNGFRMHVYTRRFIRSKDPGHCLLRLDSLAMTTTLVLNLLGTLLFVQNNNKRIMAKFLWKFYMYLWKRFVYAFTSKMFTSHLV